MSGEDSAPEEGLPSAGRNVAPVPGEEPAADIDHILEQLPAGQRAEVLRIIASMESHSGWLPSPKYLRDYEAILPGLAERIVALPEREQAHRHKVVEQAVRDDAALKRRGQALAMASLVLLLALSVLLIAEGEYAWGARIAIFGIVGVVGIFVTGRWADIKAAKASAEKEEESS